MKKTGVIGMVVAVAVIIIGLGMWLFPEAEAPAIRRLITAE